MSAAFEPFAYRYMIDAIMVRDIYVVQGTILVFAALVVLIWGVASERLVEIFNRAMDSIAGI